MAPGGGVISYIVTVEGAGSDSFRFKNEKHQGSITGSVFSGGIIKAKTG